MRGLHNEIIIQHFPLLQTLENVFFRRGERESGESRESKRREISLMCALCCRCCVCDASQCCISSVGRGPLDSYDDV